MKPKIMILGAGIYQVPLIQKARQMGLETIVVSIPGNYPGFSLADHILFLNTRDPDAVLAAAKKEQISGITTAGTDVAVRTIGAVAHALHLPGISAEAASTVTNKFTMKKAFVRGGVRTAAFFQVFSLEDALKSAETLGYPVCLKVVDQSGSRGVCKVSAPSEMEDAFLECISFTHEAYLLIEEYIDAEEIGVDGFVENGKLVFCAPHKKFVYRSGPVSIPGGHAFPYACTKTLQEEIRRQMELAVAATGIDHSAVNADLFVRKNEVFLIEIGGRTGATCIPELLSLHYGFDYYEKIIQAALGDCPDFTSVSSVPCMAKLLFTRKSGYLSSIDPEPLSELTKQGVQWHIDYPAGSLLPAVKNGTDRIGHVIAPAQKEEEIDHCLSVLRSSLQIKPC